MRRFGRFRQCGSRPFTAGDRHQHFVEIADADFPLVLHRAISLRLQRELAFLEIAKDPEAMARLREMQG